MASSIAGNVGSKTAAIILTLTTIDASLGASIQQTVSDASGNYSFSGLIDGSYSLVASSHPAYAQLLILASSTLVNINFSA